MEQHLKYHEFFINSMSELKLVIFWIFKEESSIIAIKTMTVEFDESHPDRRNRNNYPLKAHTHAMNG